MKIADNASDEASKSQRGQPFWRWHASQIKLQTLDTCQNKTLPDFDCYPSPPILFFAVFLLDPFVLRHLTYCRIGLATTRVANFHTLRIGNCPQRVNSNTAKWLCVPLRLPQPQPQPWPLRVALPRTFAMFSFSKFLLLILNIFVYSASCVNSGCGPIQSAFQLYRI